MILFMVPAVTRAEEPIRYVFPNDAASVVNLKTDLGAKGDGIADDTEAIQKGIDLSCRNPKPKTMVLFIPVGVYKVTRTIVVQNGIGPWVYGESRDGVVIKLADGVKNVTAVIRTHPNEKGPTSADWFMRNFRNFTIDVGNNPETDGIRWFSTNSGILKYVTIKGHGKNGIHHGFLDQSGPSLIQDVVVDGFETGIVSQWAWSQTLSRVTIRNSRKVGLYVQGNVVAAEKLTIENVPEPVRVTVPNDWYWWGGVLALHGANITRDGMSTKGPAIFNQSVLYGRDLTVKGYDLAIQSTTPSGNRTGPVIKEYSSDAPRKSFSSADRSIGLEVKSEPVVPWELNLSKWRCANDDGAIPGDNQDDTAAIQKCIDLAAKAGQTTVYFRGCGGGDPNHFDVKGEIRVHGSVNRIMGLGYGRIIGANGGRFVISDDSAQVVHFQNIDAFGGPPVIVENRSQSKTLCVESCGVHIVGTGLGDIFATDCPCLVDLRNPGQKMWCRQLNPEGDLPGGLVKNSGADLWILGMKNEGVGTRILTQNQGRTEVFGVFNYGPGMKEGDLRPAFDVLDSSMTIAGMRELTFGKNPFMTKVRERRGHEVRLTNAASGEHYWIGWALFQGWNEPSKQK